MVRRITLFFVVVACVVGLGLSLAGLPGPGTEARAQEPAVKDDMMKMKMMDMLKDETRMMMAKDEMKRDPNAMNLMMMRMIVKDVVMEMKKDPQMMAMMKERMAMMKKDEMMMMDPQKKMAMMQAMMRDEKGVKQMIREVLMEMMMSEMMMKEKMDK